MGTIQSKIREGYCLAQKPCLKKKTQNSLKPLSDFHDKSQIYRKNSEAQNGEVAQLSQISMHQASLTQMQSCQSIDSFSLDADYSPNCNSYPATAIGLVQSTIDGNFQFGTGSLIGSNIVLTTAHQLFSLKSKTEATSIKFFLNYGSSQEQFDVEKAFFSQSYRNWQAKSQENQGKVFLEDFGILILKSHANIQKYGLLGFDFNQNIEERDFQIQLFGFNERKKSLKIQNISLKARMKEYCIKYRTFFNFTFTGSPIIHKQNGNYKIIGIQNQRYQHNQAFQQKSLRLNEKMYNQICQWVTKQEEQLDLRDKSLGKEGVKKLIKLQKTSLSIINLSRNKIGTEGLKYFTRCQWNNLHHLDIGGNFIKKEGVMHLVKIPMKNLLCLNMWGNQIGSDGALLLLDADWKYLSNINLYNNNICNEGIKSLIKANWIQLQSINLGKNSINDTIISSFQYSTWKNIVSLNLWGNLLKNCKTVETELKKHFVKMKFLFL